MSLGVHPVAAKRIEELQDIPRYPPFMQGLPVCSPEALIETQSDLIKRIYNLVPTTETVEKHYKPAVYRLASFVHLLPASQSHHHRGAGGLLRHSLEVGLWSLQQTERMLIRGVTTPKSRRAIEPRWRLAVFFAGICHDLGKAVTDLAVTDRESKERWRPYNQSLYEWAQSLDISNYFLHWQEGRAKHHTSVSSTVINNIIGKASFDWISTESTEVLIWLTESINCNPGQTNQIYDLVVKADQLSVERDLKTMGVAMAGYEIGVPIERYLTDIMRRLVREGIWRINEPAARIWNIGGHIYLVWPAAGEEIAKRASGEDIPGLPKTPDGILDMMVEREIAYLREGEGDRYYYIAPSVLTEKIPDLKLKAIRLRDQALISSAIIPPVDGMIAEGGEQMTEDRASTHLPSVLDENEPKASFEQAERSGQTSKASFEQAERSGQTSKASFEQAERSGQTIKASFEERQNKQSELQPEDRDEGAAMPHNELPPVLSSLPSEELTGSMGEILKVLIDEFRTGKKSLRDLAAMDAGGCLHLKWPDAFAGYGFAPKQILDGLTEHGWMEPHSEMVKVGEAEFAHGTAKSIKLVRPVSDLFPRSPGCNERPVKTPPEVVLEASQQPLFPTRTEPRKARQKRAPKRAEGELRENEAQRPNERCGKLDLNHEISPYSFSQRLFDALFAEVKSKKIKPDADGYFAMPKRDAVGLTQKLSGLACASKALGKLQVDKAIISGQTTVRFCQQKQSKQ